MAALDGSAVLLLVQTSAGPPGVYTVVGSQTGVKFQRKTTMADASNKSSPEKVYIAGERDETIALDHLYVSGDAGLAALKSAWANNLPIVVERQESGTVIEYASAYISDLTEDFKKAVAGTVSVTLQVSGGWTPGAAP